MLRDLINIRLNTDHPQTVCNLCGGGVGLVWLAMHRTDYPEIDQGIYLNFLIFVLLHSLLLRRILW